MDDPVFEYIIVGASAGGAYLARKLSESGKSVCYVHETPMTERDYACETTREHAMPGLAGVSALGRQFVLKRGLDCFLPDLSEHFHSQSWQDWDLSGAQGWTGWGVESALREALDEIRYRQNACFHEEHPLFIQPFIEELALKASVAKPFVRHAVAGGMYRFTDLILHNVTERLYVERNARVQDILFIDKHAHGVTLKTANRIQLYRAEHEIILAGHPIRSLQLLMHSGIGSAQDVERKNTVHINENVGRSVFDRPILRMSYKRKQPSSWFVPPMKARLRQVEDCRKHGDPLPLFTSLFAGGYASSAHYESSPPDHQILFFMRDASQLDVEITLLDPRSSGKVTDATHNRQALFGDFAYLGQGSDRRRLAAMAAAVHTEITAQQDFSGDGVFLNDRYAPISPVEWEKFVTDHVTGSGQLFGGCKMGRGHDPTCVVDPELFVYGTSGLRIADSSVAPNIVSTDYQACSLAMGALAYALITKGSMGLSHKDEEPAVA